MEVNIRNTSSRILLEKADNGIILYDIGEDNVVSSKLLYEIYQKNGIIDFHSMAMAMLEIMEILKIPTAEQETNRCIKITLEKIDPAKPMAGEEENKED